MKGKIFESSVDVYQDQASVLFDFYRKAAEKIIEQEDAFDRQTEELNHEISDIEESKNNVSRDYGIAGGLALLGLILAFILNPIVGVIVLVGGAVFAAKTYFFVKGVDEQIEEVNQRKEEVATKKSGIFRDYRVSKLGVVYVPVAKQVSVGDRSVIIDLTGSTEKTNVSLQVANNPEALVSTLNSLEQLSTEAPIIEEAEQVEQVETSEYSSSIQDVKFYDYFGTLDRTLRSGAYYLSDLTTKTIQVPFVRPESELRSYLDIFTSTEITDEEVLSVFDTNQYTLEIDQFQQIDNFHKQFAEQNANFEEVLKHLVANIGVAVQTVATLKVASNNRLIESSNRLLFTILKNSYNHYSPLLEHEEIEQMRNTNFNYSDTVETYRPFQLKASSRVKYDALTGNWVAEDGSITTMPFGISQIQEEIVAPIVQNLIAETRIERMRIYNDIKNQKINYLNQWHQDTEDFYGRNRSSSDDLLNIMRSNLTKMLAAQATVQSVTGIRSNMRQQMLSGTANEIEQTDANSIDQEQLAAFELQSQQFRQSQDDFDDYMDRLKEDIDDRARQFEFIEYYDATLRDQLAKDLITAGDEQDCLDARRRPLASINPYYAQASVLPPKPSVDESVAEQMSLNVARYAANTLQEINENANESAPEETPEETPAPGEGTNPTADTDSDDKSNY